MNDFGWCTHPWPVNRGRSCDLPEGHDGPHQVTYPSTAQPGIDRVSTWLDDDGGTVERDG